MLLSANYADAHNIDDSSHPERYKNSGTLSLMTANVVNPVGFVEHLQHGLMINFSVGIDFTGSNGDPTQPYETLTTLNPPPLSVVHLDFCIKFEDRYLLYHYADVYPTGIIQIIQIEDFRGCAPHLFSCNGGRSTTTISAYPLYPGRLQATSGIHMLTTVHGCKSDMLRYAGHRCIT